MKPIFIFISFCIVNTVSAQTKPYSYKVIKQSSVKIDDLGDISYDGKEKDFKLVITEAGKDANNLMIFVGDVETPLEEDKRTVKDDSTTFNLSELENGQTHEIFVCFKNKDNKLAKFRMVPSPGNNSERERQGEKQDKPDFWKYVKNPSLNLKQYYINTSSLCDDCAGDETEQFLGHDRIVYNALSRTTYFFPADKGMSGSVCKSAHTIKDYRIGRKKPLRLKAGNEVLFIVQNVNPRLFDIELTDTSFLVNVEPPGILEKLLLSKTDDMNLESSGEADATEIEEYKRVRAGLVLLNAELGTLLENFRLANRFFHHCIQPKKVQAIAHVDSFIRDDLGKKQFGAISLPAFVDIYLDPTVKLDSTLSKQIKTNYMELLTSSYTIAYRFLIPEKDIIEFNLSIKRKPDAPYPSLLDSKGKLPTHTAAIKNFFKIDASAGIYYGKIRDDSYRTRLDSFFSKTSTGADSLVKGNRIIKEDMGNGEIGFSGFLHFYYKYSTWLNLGGIIGAGVNFDDKPQARYFTGLSLMLGKYNRLSFNGGYMWGNQNVISNQYPREADGSYRLLPSSETTLTTIKKFKSAPFISISYNIPFIKRKAEVKPPEKPSEPPKPTKPSNPTDDGNKGEKDNKKTNEKS